MRITCSCKMLAIIDKASGETLTEYCKEHSKRFKTKALAEQFGLALAKDFIDSEEKKSNATTKR